MRLADLLQRDGVTRLDAKVSGRVLEAELIAESPSPRLMLFEVVGDGRLRALSFASEEDVARLRDGSLHPDKGCVLVLRFRPPAENM